jgi:DNA-binding MarR family transcriptional regulator
MSCVAKYRELPMATKQGAKRREVADRLLSDENNSPAGIVFTELVLEIFRINGRLLASGERLTNDLGLTSARWQVLGSIPASPLTVAQIARNMGLQRQSVQRIVDLLAAEGMVELVVNPNHRRAKLVQPTAKGRVKLKRLNGRRIEWSRRIAGEVPAKMVSEALSTLQQLRHNLEADEP